MAEPGPRPASSHRTWPERLAITGTILAAVLSFLAAGTLVAAYVIVGRRARRADHQPRRGGAAADVRSPAVRRRTVAPGATAPPAPATTTNETFPPADPGGAELPAHRRRQRRLCRSRLAVRTGVRRRQQRPCRRAQRHDHGLPRRPDRRPSGGAVVPPRPLRHHRRHERQEPDQLGIPPQRAATPDRHDLPELRHRHRPLHPGRLLHVQDARRRRRRGHRAVRLPGPRPEHRAERADHRLLHVQRRPRAGLRALSPLSVRGPAGQRELEDRPIV